MKNISRNIIGWSVVGITLASDFAFAQETADDAEKTEDSTLQLSADVSSSPNITGIENDRLKAGDVNLDDIPRMIASLIQFGIAIAGTISILMLIYFAVQMQLRSGITGDTTGVERAKKGMFAAAVGFVISISAWFIMARVIDLLGGIGA